MSYEATIQKAAQEIDALRQRCVGYERLFEAAEKGGVLGQLAKLLNLVPPKEDQPLYYMLYRRAATTTLPSATLRTAAHRLHIENPDASQNAIFIVATNGAIMGQDRESLYTQYPNLRLWESCADHQTAHNLVRALNGLPPEKV